MKSLKIFLIGIMNGATLGFFNLSYWSCVLEVGITSIIIMILFRDKL